MMVGFAAFLITLVLTGLTGWHARHRGLLDLPDERSSHRTAVPSGGGLGMILAWFFVTLLLLLDRSPAIWLFALLPGLLLLAVVGWMDDHKPISARFRFLVQLAVSICVLAFAWHQGVTGSVIWLAVTAFWLLSIANFYNFMDGSHGMAGMQGLFSGLVLAWLFQRTGSDGMAMVSFMVAASCAGFLPWNLRQKRIFMGDVGSVPLGFVLAALCAYGVAMGNFSPWLAVLVLVVFLVDASLTLLWRVLRGERWYTPHRQHLYQQLITRGCSHQSVLALYTMINICLVLPAAVVSVRNPGIAWLVSSVLIATMVVGWTLSIRRLGATA
ncbi:MAG TPA: glycosyltransferase family 4 protein [Xanthomonadales bacterium]|nr:glycosyltransferase family 4 protein [Xanthomonadales bacterium]